MAFCLSEKSRRIAAVKVRLPTIVTSSCESLSIPRISSAQEACPEGTFGPSSNFFGGSGRGNRCRDDDNTRRNSGRMRG